MNLYSGYVMWCLLVIVFYVYVVIVNMYGKGNLNFKDGGCWWF